MGGQVVTGQMGTEQMAIGQMGTEQMAIGQIRVGYVRNTESPSDHYSSIGQMGWTDGD